MLCVNLLLRDTAISCVGEILRDQGCILCSYMSKVICIGHLKVRAAGWRHTCRLWKRWCSVSGICWLLLEMHSTFIPGTVLTPEGAQTLSNPSTHSRPV